MDDFDFGGVIPDSDEEEIYAAEPTYDAVNDETFGGDVGDIPSDFSSFAVDSLALNLANTNIEDEQPCSSRDIRRPVDTGRRGEPSQGGLPSMYRDSVYDSSASEQLRAQEAALRSVESIWNSAGLDFTGFTQSQPVQPTRKPQLPATPSAPSGALTLDEIERHQLLSSGAVHFPLAGSDPSNMMHQAHVANPPPGHIGVNRPSPRPPGDARWAQPVVAGITDAVPGNRNPIKAVTAEELEAKLVQEYNMKRVPKEQQTPQQQTPRNDNSSEPPHLPVPPGPLFGFPGGPPMNPMIAAQQFYQYQMMSAMMRQQQSGQPGPPPPMPPFPPMNYPAMMAMNGGRMPFPPMPPGMPMPPPPPPPAGPMFPPQFPMRVQTPQRSQNVTPSPMNPLNTPLSQVYQQSDPRSSPNIMTGCTSPNGSITSRNRRRVGMPSKRTITDFACDPYAGFMSKKEREWLIKIQLIQCLGTGDKYVDDYYYSCWKQQNTLQKRPDSWKQPKIRGKYYNLEETYPSNYTPPSFSGVLGKSIGSSTSMPRQCFKVLDVTPIDDDDESVVSGVTTTSKDMHKRRLRTVLLTIENGFLLLLECEDLLRRIHIPDESEQCLHDLSSKLGSLFNASLDEGSIPMTMVINKGRRLVARSINISTPPMKTQIIVNVFNTLRKYSRKVSTTNNCEFIHTVLKALSTIDGKLLVELFTRADAERFKDTLAYSSFSQNLLATLLIVCAKRGFCIEEIVPTSSFVTLLQSERSMLNGLGNAFNELFTPVELETFATWLGSSSICAKGNVAALYLTSALSALNG